MSERIDKTVLISGCSSGIGRALAAGFKARGYRVFATARRQSSLDELVAAGFETVRLDITDDASVRAAVEYVLAEAGQIDYLVNNAGHGLFGPLAEVPLDEVQHLFNTNVLSQLRMIQAVVPHMAARRSGCIVNVGSVMGFTTTPFVGAYSATKAAFHNLSEALRMEVAPLGLSVVVVQPGGIQSEVANHGAEHSGLDRYDQTGSLYHRVSDQVRRRAMASQDKATPTDKFAAAVLDDLLVSKPPRVIRSGRGSGFLYLLSRLPASLREAILSRHFQLRRLKDPV